MYTGSLHLYLPGRSRWLPVAVVLVSVTVILVLLALGAAFDAGSGASTPADPELLAPFRWPGSSSRMA